MTMLILGLLVFLGVHSLRIVADDWRGRQLAKMGEMRWKGLYTLVSLISFVLLCWGFGLARQQPVVVYVPPLFLRHLNALFTLIAFVLVVAAYVPRNHLKAKFGHPMLLGVKAWAFGHLLATGMLRDVVLFGAFLLWAVVLFVVSRRRDRAAGTTYPAGTLQGDAVTLLVGIAFWVAFAFWLHLWLIGVKPIV
ncbi:MAG: NnrU family protein [Rhodanobacter sp.]